MKSITNETEYNAIIKRLNELLEIVTDENYDTLPEAIELDFLSALVEEYENKYYPIEQPTMVDIMKLRMYEMGINQNVRLLCWVNGRCNALWLKIFLL